MLGRGVIVSCETVRRWCLKFGQSYTNALRRRRPRTGDRWHLDEVFVKINGVRHDLWRAVDQDGNVLDILVRSRRDAPAARRFPAKPMKKQCRVPRMLVTDRLRFYGVASPGVDALGRTPAVEVPRQPGGELPPAHPAARTREEGLLFHHRDTAAPVRVQRHPTALPAPPPPDDRPRLPHRDGHPLRRLGPGHRRRRPAHSRTRAVRYCCRHRCSPSAPSYQVGFTDGSTASRVRSSASRTNGPTDRPC